MVSRRKKRQVERRSERSAPGVVRVNVSELAPYNSYGVPTFVKRGYYEDVPFTCKGCGVAQRWTAWQQKWWYEVAERLCGLNCEALQSVPPSRAGSPRRSKACAS